MVLKIKFHKNKYIVKGIIFFFLDWATDDAFMLQGWMHQIRWNIWAGAYKINPLCLKKQKILNLVFEKL